jgi:hypothetical protein
VEAKTTPEDLAEQIERLTEERNQLAAALESRVVIEQAKGILAERYGLSVGDAFLLLRQSARSAQMKIHLLAGQVVESPATPGAVVRGMARDSRWRAVAMRERNEATVERTRDLHLAHLEQRERAARHSGAIIRVRATTRWDALELGSRLRRHRWYLVAPDEHHWDVVVEVGGRPRELPGEVRHAIEEWVRARQLEPVTVRFGDVELRIPG